MNSTDLLRMLLETTLASSAAMLLVLLLRTPVRRHLGASAAYLLWLALPVAMAAVLLPAPRMEVAQMQAVGGVVQAGIVAVEARAPLLPWPLLAGAAWLAGAVLMAAWLWRQQRRFVRGLGQLQRRDDGCWQAQGVAGLPAVIGVLQPKIVLPAGFEQRYSAHERQLVLLHEDVHLRRGDIVLNALLALAQCVYWFNPLLPLALRRCREDQELSCDERVIARSAGARRSYATAMLKTGLAESPLPVGCHWQNQHPLKERIAMLKRPVPGKKQWFAMVLLVAGVSCGVGYAAWAAQPARDVLGETAKIYATVVQIDVGGVKRQFELHQPAGKPFGFAFETDKGVAWKGELRVDPAAHGQLQVSGELRTEGRVILVPVRVIPEGANARMDMSMPDGTALLGLELRVSEIGAAGEGKAKLAAPGNAGHITVEPESSGVPARMPVMDRMPPPVYPREAYQNGIVGNVVLVIEVATDGTPTDVRVESAQPQGVFDASAIAAAKQWKFNPAMEDGKPVAGKVRVPIQFDLHEDAEHAADAGSSET